MAYTEGRWIKHIYYGLAFFFVMRGNKESNGFTAISRNDGSMSYRRTIEHVTHIQSLWFDDTTEMHSLVRLIWKGK